MEVIFLLRICKIWFGHLSLSLKFEFDPTNGCGDIPLFIFYGGHLSFKDLERKKFGHLSLSLKFEFDPINACGDIPLLIF